MCNSFHAGRQRYPHERQKIGADSTCRGERKNVGAKVLKGHDFSRAIGYPKCPALAAEGHLWPVQHESPSYPQPLWPPRERQIISVCISPGGSLPRLLFMPPIKVPFHIRLHNPMIGSCGRPNPHAEVDLPIWGHIQVDGGDRQSLLQGLPGVLRPGEGAWRLLTYHGPREGSPAQKLAPDVELGAQTTGVHGVDRWRSRSTRLSVILLNMRTGETAKN
jgi:hypothetical protein